MADEIIKGGRELDAFLQSLPVKVEKNILRSALRAGANEFKSEIKANAPVDDGDLRNSVRVSTRAKSGTVSASVKIGDKKAWYAHLVEYGTRAHLIKVQESERPINYRLTAKRGKLTYMSMTTVNRNVLRIGSTFVGPTVQHPGARPHPFVRPALDTKAGAAVAATAAKIRERLTKEGINAPAPEGE